MLKKSLFVLGGLCFAFVAIPLLGYGIMNMGVLALTAIGVLLILLPALWAKIAGIKWLKRFIIAAIILGLGYCGFVSAWMLRCAYFNAPPKQSGYTLVVLGGGIRGDEPMLMLRRRLNAAWRYMKEDPDAVCIVTGGQGPDEDYTEAWVMKKYLTENGVGPDRVIMEEQSTNTRENIAFAWALVPDKNTPVIIVTDEFHQLRANLFASQYQKAFGISSATPWGLLPAYWLRDMLGVAVAFLQTRG